MSGDAPPFLDVAGARIGDADPVTFRSSANHLVLVGAPSTLVRALAGVELPNAGDVRIEGQHAATWFARGELALADVTEALPDKWSIRRYVETSAQLAAAPTGSGSAKERAQKALAELALAPMADVLLDRATRAARVATHLAAALATGAPRIVVHEPLSHLGAEELAPIASFVKDALRARSFIVATVHMHPLLAEIAGEIAFFRAGLPVRQGSAAALAEGAALFYARVLGSPEPLARALGARGIKADPSGGGLAFALPDGEGTRIVFEAAKDADALVTELAPLYKWPAS